MRFGRPVSMRRGLAMRIGVAAALVLAPSLLRADAAAQPADDTTGSIGTARDETFPARAAMRTLIEQEVLGTGLPADIAEAVVYVESRYDSSVIGSVGEVGAMQVRPETAAMLGFHGSDTELARPEINIHYGVTYLAKAWRLGHGDLCRALMKYRAGHGEETMTPRSVIYCNRARNRLVAMNSPFAAGNVAEIPQPAEQVAAKAPETKPLARSNPKAVAARPSRPAEVYARLKQGTAAASRAFWAVHEARVRAIKARIEAKWHRVASR